ncbi:S-adenosyl-L-methionine-dependent methyltransferase [Rhizopus microsporus var. microsporus]|uniref:S-adenosyl-L-methionine-dependent methyltransferase n=1 Tax=Rhizopus microsporus var. microsporus TaxID=86635 RepID=A0A1X0R6J4_RHIZD|nr:S-adenosyl-L-methionine-dependent methyltransferase [Rhizopus microsporus var. microsporus]
MFNTSNNTNNNNSNGGITSFLKLKWRTSTKYNIKPRLPNTVDDIERDWVRHNALKLAFENDFKAPIERLLQAGGSEVLDIGCGAGFWTTDMAARFPLSYFIGLDIDKNVLPTSPCGRNVLYQHMDLIELPLPFEDATFDYVFVRSMLSTMPDHLWDDVLKELIRIMKKGAYIECVEAYDNLFDTGPSMNILIELVLRSTQQPPYSPTKENSRNPWPNRLANISQLMGMQIHHTHTPVGFHGGEIGALLLEYWERMISSYRDEWIANKWIDEEELEKTIELMKEEVEEHNTYMSWYSVVARKKGYTGPVLQFDDVDDDGTVYTTTCC